MVSTNKFHKPINVRYDNFVTKSNSRFNNEFEYPQFPPDNWYDGYSKLEVKHKLCGHVFKMHFFNHLIIKCACPKCFSERADPTIEARYFDLIKKSKSIYGDSFIFPETVPETFKNVKCKIPITCKTCGSTFNQLIVSHLHKKKGCPVCARNEITRKLKLNADKSAEFRYRCAIEKSKSLKPGEFEYPDEMPTGWKNSHTKIEIKCLSCGLIFKQPLNAHTVGGCGCPNCIESIGEKCIRKWFKNTSVDPTPQKSFHGFKSDIGGTLKYDFFASSHNLLIEYDGIQHFKPVNRFGGESAFNRSVLNDRLKNVYAFIHGIRLLRIPYTQFKNTDKILKEELAKPFVIVDPRRLLNA